MQEAQPTDARLYFWALGDLHYRAIAAWHELHSQRLNVMFEDLHELWQQEGKPAFCVSPGDLVETCAWENYQLAKTSLAQQLDDIPFYPGTGNHEYYGLDGEDPSQMAHMFTMAWERPLRYTWQVGNIICIMLDYPDPQTLESFDRVYISQEALAFLDTSLREHADQPALIFHHCPLFNTVLDRDPVQYRDYNSLQHFFAPENSQEVRDILARHKNACLYFSGHTHSGWEAPNLVCTEQLGGHPVTFVNLMSPWYTGAHTGPRLAADRLAASYILDDPDVIPTFAVRVYQDYASIRVRDHRTHQWLKEWIVPLS